jgi:hypothetical protein
MERSEPGEEVAIPILPAFVTMKLVAVDEPMAKAGPVMPFGFTESFAHGVVVPMPTEPWRFAKIIFPGAPADDPEPPAPGFIMMSPPMPPGPAPPLSPPSPAVSIIAPPFAAGLLEI